MSGPVVTVHIDGAARGNPGPAAFAFVIAQDGKPPIEEAGRIGRATNNVAEYTALVRALERAAQQGGGRLHIRSDSELLVRQMKGEYRVKNEDLQVLYQEAKQLCRKFESVSFEHVPRAQNARADELCNIALDGGSRREAPRRKAAAAGLSPGADGCGARGGHCLLERRGRRLETRRPGAPRPEDVWDQLWSILQEHDIVRAVSRR